MQHALNVREGVWHYVEQERKNVTIIRALRNKIPSACNNNLCAGINNVSRRNNNPSA